MQFRVGSQMFRFDICNSTNNQPVIVFFVFCLRLIWAQVKSARFCFSGFHENISRTLITKISTARKVLTWCKKNNKSDAAAWKVWRCRSVMAHLIIIMRRTCCPTIPLACFCFLRDAGERIITHFHWSQVNSNRPLKCRNPQNRILQFVSMPMSDVPFDVLPAWITEWQSLRVFVWSRSFRSCSLLNVCRGSAS